MGRQDEEVFEVISSRDREQMERQAEENLTLAEKQTKSLFEEMSGKFEQATGTIYLKRQVGPNNFESLEDFPTDKFPDEENLISYIRLTFGPGDYRVMAKIAGKRGWAINKLITIGKTLEQLEDEKMKRRGGMPAVIPEGQNNQVMFAVLEGQRQTQEMFRQMMEKRNSAFEFLKNPEILAIVAPIAGQLMTGLLQRNNGPDPISQLKQLMEIKEMMGGNEKSDDKSTMAMIGQAAMGFVQGFRQPQAETPRMPAPPMPQPAALSEAIKEAEPEPWSPDDVADYLESVAANPNLDNSDVATNVKNTVLKNIKSGDIQTIMQGMVLVEPGAYDKLKPLAIKHFQFPDILIQQIEEARAEYFSTDQSEPTAENAINEE